MKETKGPLFQLDGTPKLSQMIPLSLQHVVAMIVGCVTVPILVSNASGSSAADSVALIQACLVFSGLAIFLQLLPLGRVVGSKLPLITGASFVFMPAYMAIGARFGMATMFGAQLVGSAAVIVMGLFINKIRRFFPPLVTGTIILTIGLSLYTTAINYMAGGLGSPDYGSAKSWLLALFTMAVVFACSHFGKGILKLASILVGVAVGYAVALPLGMVDFEPVRQAGWIQLPVPLRFGLDFEVGAIVTVIFVSIVNAVEMIGDITSTTTGGLDRQPHDEELRGGIVASGLSSLVGAFFGGIAVGSYSQNVGIVITNKVVNRRVFACAAGIVILTGLVPKLSALFTTIPQCVLGGAIVSVFGSITMTGIRLVCHQALNGRNMSIVGLAVALGMGVTLAPESLMGLPQWVSTLFGTSAVVLSGSIAILLNLILPENNAED